MLRNLVVEKEQREDTSLSKELENMRICQQEIQPDGTEIEEEEDLSYWEKLGILEEDEFTNQGEEEEIRQLLTQGGTDQP